MTHARILVTGADGQLGRSLRRLATSEAGDFVFASRSDLDIADQNAITKYFASQTFDFCINTAAYTKVDLAEEQEAQAYLINATAPGLLAHACSKQNCVFIHLSSDYVYHNDLRRPLKEDDPLSPQSVYARTKLAGEQRALKANPHTLIIRTSWLFSEFGQNFVKTIARLIREHSALRIVDDQIGCPTYAGDLGQAILRIIHVLHARQHSEVYGIYNYCNEGAVTWYDFAREIAELLGSNAEIHPVHSADYGAPASRPSYSVLDTTKIRAAFGVLTPHWREGLGRALYPPVGA